MIWVASAAVWWAADWPMWWGPEPGPSGCSIYAVLGAAMIQARFMLCPAGAVRGEPSGAVGSSRTSRVRQDTEQGVGHAKHGQDPRRHGASRSVQSRSRRSRAVPARPADQHVHGGEGGRPGRCPPGTTFTVEVHVHEPPVRALARLAIPRPGDHLRRRPATPTTVEQRHHVGGRPAAPRWRPPTAAQLRSRTQCAMTHGSTDQIGPPFLGNWPRRQRGDVRRRDRRRRHHHRHQLVPDAPPIRAGHPGGTGGPGGPGVHRVGPPTPGDPDGDRRRMILRWLRS